METSCFLANNVISSRWLCTLTLWRPLLPYRYSYKASCARPIKRSFVIFDIRALWRSDSVPARQSVHCPDVKTYKWRLNPTRYRMLYSCRPTHMVRVGVKGLTYLKSVPLFGPPCRSDGEESVDQSQDSGRRRRRRSNFALDALNCFAGGVFLGTSLLHMLPDVSHDIEEARPAIADAGFQLPAKFPTAEFLTSVGFLVVLLLEEVNQPNNSPT